MTYDPDREARVDAIAARIDGTLTNEIGRRPSSYQVIDWMTKRLIESMARIEVLEDEIVELRREVFR